MVVRRNANGKKDTGIKSDLKAIFNKKILPEGSGIMRGEEDRKSTRLNSSHRLTSRMPSSA